LITPHSGSINGIPDAAKRLSARMFTKYADVFNVESRIAATDIDGMLRWAVSPNFRSLAEIGTDDARYIWGLGLTELRQ
jgi:hypothetical protein